MQLLGILSLKLERCARSVLYPVTSPASRRRMIAARDAAVGVAAQLRGSSRWSSALPDFVIAGVQKGGTTFLFQEMLRHPHVKASLTKEVHFFDQHFDRGLVWYRGMFPRSIRRAPILRAEASPSYIFEPHALERIRNTLDDVRLIVVVRDPVARAHSHYLHERRLGYEPATTFEEALALEGGRLDAIASLPVDDPGARFVRSHFTYVARGMYVPQLEHAADLFGRDRLLVLFSENLFASPDSIVQEALDFVGASPAPLAAGGGNDMSFGATAVDEATAADLRKVFQAPNARLAGWLGSPVPW